MKIDKMGNILVIDPYNQEQNNYAKRIGYFSGTFDPFHLGHKRVLELSIPLLDEIWIQAHNYNPKKTPIDLKHRQNMILKTINGSLSIFLLDYPQELSEDKYKLMNELEKNILGLSIVDLIGQDHLRRTINYGITRPVICISRKKYPNEECRNITFINNDQSFISSSEIRAKIKDKDFSSLPLAEEVLKYISQNQLYQ